MSDMDWKKLLTYSPFTPEGEIIKRDLDFNRTQFQTDYDRITFSQEFRRLDKKTQVHPLKSNDHVHARLSHSLETSCVGRSLGAIAGTFLKDIEDFHPYSDQISNKKNSDILMPIFLGQIVQTACLAHDIGNPPFGHAGEGHIQDWFKENKDSALLCDLNKDEFDDFANFEGNAQAFRILTKTSMRVGQGGMGISYAVLGTMMKYPWVYSDKLPKAKFSSFDSEKDYLKHVAEACGLLKSDFSEDGYSFVRHPLAYLSEASDDICYNIIDLEDAYELGILDYKTVYDVFIEFCKCGNDKFECIRYESAENKQNNLAHLRAIAINSCINSVIEEFKKNYEDIIRGKKDIGYSLTGECSVREIMEKAKGISKTRVFTSAKKADLEHQAKNVLCFLLDSFIGTVHSMHTIGRENMSVFHRQLLDMMGNNKPKAEDSLYNKYQKVLDYISGMTDNYAMKVSKLINEIKY
ncbi:MAG: deoxyguanosinetriphosphate triphosphohydrolase [Deferribacterales bacterium]